MRLRSQLSCQCKPTLVKSILQFGQPIPRDSFMAHGGQVGQQMVSSIQLSLVSEGDFWRRGYQSITH